MTSAEQERAKVVAAQDELDAWCKRQAEANTSAFCEAFYGGANVMSAPMRHLHGQGYAYARVRSFISGAKREHLAKTGQ